MIDEDSLLERKAAMLPHLDERQRNLFAAVKAKARSLTIRRANRFHLFVAGRTHASRLVA